jgi:hypothetical protein
MDELSRQRVLDLLMGDWADYIARFKALSPVMQAAFLEQQGYQRLGDLLAHFVAWWDEGLRSIQRYQSDPAARSPEIDVDDFNAQAVEKAAGLNETELILLFEQARCHFVAVVQALSDKDLRDERVLNQIKMELINHLEEHRIP